MHPGPKTPHSLLRTPPLNGSVWAPTGSCPPDAVQPWGPPKLVTATPEHPVQRAGLTGAFAIGLAMTRYVLANPPVASLSREELCRWAVPVTRQLLTVPAAS